jgi:hypothetical protein
MTQQETPRRPGRRPILTPEIVESCKARLAAESANDTIASLAREYNVHSTTMRMAVRGTTWANRDPASVPEPEGMRRIPGYSAYFADRRGDIYSARQSDSLKPLAFGASGKGRKVFLIADGAEKGHTAQVHDLICAAWHGPRPTDRHRVRHIDEDRTHNSPDNLAWGEPGEVPRSGGGATGEAHGRSKLTDADVLQVLAYAAAGERPADIARHKHVHPTTISGIVARRLWSHVQIPDGGLPAVAPLPHADRRVSSGQNHGRAKLNDAAVGRIRLSLPHKSNAELAKEEKVHPTTIARIRSGRGWRAP